MYQPGLWEYRTETFDVEKTQGKSSHAVLQQQRK